MNDAASKKPLISRTRTRLLLGAVALLPILAIGYLLYEVFSIFQEILTPLSARLGAHPVLNLILLLILAVIAVAAICYGFGLLITTRIGAVSFAKVEGRVRDLVPGYEIISGLLKGMATEKNSYHPALITLGAPGTAVLGFVMEDAADEDARYVTVFVPTAPILTAGAIHVVERSRVQLLEGSAGDAANCITKWGLGLRKFRGSIEPLKSIGTTGGPAG
ncbi:MAG: DUF502 domain-containing protein [Bauldia sp.]|nr:DUF502 domain-containing protein [Bauldia sp.]